MSPGVMVIYMFDLSNILHDSLLEKENINNTDILGDKVTHIGEMKSQTLAIGEMKSQTLAICGIILPIQ
eukprot:scaffold421275_cov58-Attheya_sp.AAC.3